MAYNQNLADKVREALKALPNVEEKKMFSGLAFLVDEKMCINVSDDHLMCRFNPSVQETVAARKGYQPMIMKGRELRGYCYVSEEGYSAKKDFDYWIGLCLDYN